MKHIRYNWKKLNESFFDDIKDDIGQDYSDSIKSLYISDMADCENGEQVANLVIKYSKLEELLKVIFENTKGGLSRYFGRLPIDFCKTIYNEYSDIMEDSVKYQIYCNPDKDTLNDMLNGNLLYFVLICIPTDYKNYVIKITIENHSPFINISITLQNGNTGDNILDVHTFNDYILNYKDVLNRITKKLITECESVYSNKNMEEYLL